MNKPDKFPAYWIKLAVDQVYGTEVASSTWRKWLRLFDVKPRSHYLTVEQSIFLLTYAHLRRYKPNKGLGVIDVKNHLKAYPYALKTFKEQVEQALFIETKGRDMPTLIRQYTGKTVTLRTLYRWAKRHKLEFGVSKPILKPELKRWLDIAS
jgi:hypothetical protein